MTDGAIYKLAKRAGIAVQWRDFAGRPHQVTVESLRRILAAMALPCASPNDLEESLRSLASETMPALLTATTGRAVHLSVKAVGQKARIQFESGAVADVRLETNVHGISLPPFRESGYHQIDIGDERITVAAAPARCTMVSDIAPGRRIWGLAAQVYGLRSDGDCGIGDMAGVVALGQAAASMDADVLALSPLHALFAADQAILAHIPHRAGRFTIHFTQTLLPFLRGLGRPSQGLTQTTELLLATSSIGRDRAKKSEQCSDSYSTLLTKARMSRLH